MTPERIRLRAVPPLMGETGFDYRFDVASQVMAAGPQDIHVQVIVPLSGPGQGQIGVRVGRLLVYRANRQALGSWMPGARQERWPMRHLGPICCCRQWARPSRPTRAGRGQALSGPCLLAVPESRRTVVRAFSAVARASRGKSRLPSAADQYLVKER